MKSKKSEKKYSQVNNYTKKTSSNPLSIIIMTYKKFEYVPKKDEIVAVIS